MKTLAKYHVCNHYVFGEKTFKNILIGPGKLQGISRNGPQHQMYCICNITVGHEITKYKNNVLMLKVILPTSVVRHVQSIEENIHFDAG